MRRRSTSCSSNLVCLEPGRPIAAGLPRRPIRVSALQHRVQVWCWKITTSGPIFRSTATVCLSAERVSASSISVEVIFQPGTEVEERQKLVFSVHDNTRRTMFNQADGGTVRVKDGVALARGSKTPLLRKCEEGPVSH